MTTAALVRVLLRRWYVVLLCLVGTLAIAVPLAARTGVYSTRFNVVLVAPRSPAAPDATLIADSNDLIAAAGLLERMVNADRPQSAATNQDVTLVGTGVRAGTLITLPNSGGQWDYNFSSPMLSVQVAGPTAQYVSQQRQAAISRIESTLAKMQDRDGAPSANLLMTSEVVPRDASIVYNEGHPKRAAAAALVIGFSIALVGSTALDRLALTRREKTTGRRHNPRRRPFGRMTTSGLPMGTE